MAKSGNKKSISKKTKKKSTKKSKSRKPKSKNTIKGSQTKKRSQGKKPKVNDRILTADIAFYCSNGSVFYCLNDLVAGLIIMDENTFKFHVNKEKNDFYNWIKHIFKEDELAEKIKSRKNTNSLRKVLVSYL